MIKRIIFDLDDTLIELKEKYNESIRDVFNEIGIKCDDILLKKFVDAYHEYETKTVIYNKKEMFQYIEDKINMQLDYKIMEKWFDKLAENIDPLDSSVAETLDLLSKKYDLVILTNWFTDSQVKRLKAVGIYGYFKNVYGGDMHLKKPNPVGYKKAMGDCKPEECIMIGDNLIEDVETPISLGMSAILFDKSGNKNDKYKTINKISELKEMLL